MRTSDSANLWLGFLVFLVLLGLCVHRADADVIDVTWVAPTQRVDGTALPANEIAGYRLEWTVKGAAQSPITVGPVTAYALDTGALTGKTCLTLRTVDTDGLESDPTGPVCRNAKPNPPTNLRAR